MRARRRLWIGAVCLGLTFAGVADVAAAPAAHAADGIVLSSWTPEVGNDRTVTITLHTSGGGGLQSRFSGTASLFGYVCQVAATGADSFGQASLVITESETVSGEVYTYRQNPAPPPSDPSELFCYANDLRLYGKDGSTYILDTRAAIEAAGLKLEFTIPGTNSQPPPSTPPPPPSPLSLTATPITQVTGQPVSLVAKGAGSQGALVTFHITSGPDASTFAAVIAADATGTATTTLKGSSAGTDQVVAWMDSDQDGVVDANEPSASATVTWTAPTGRYQWVQLGDSYSAGVGLGKVTPGCDQDDGAYTPQAYAALNKSRTVLSNVLINTSCSGATTADYWSSQARYIGADADIATITIGGNDVFLKNKIEGCYVGRCGPDVFGVEAGTERNKVSWDDLFNRLVAVYVDARTRLPPAGHLYVLSYPIPFGLGSGNDCQGFEYQEQLAANAFSTRLGDTIFLAVQEANKRVAQSGRSGNVHFVDWRTGTRRENMYTVPEGFPNAGQSFPVVVSPNGLCARDGKAYINGFVDTPRGANRVNSFHPNKDGYGYAASVLKSAIVRDFT
jgi:GDSL-like Lipase/Acylhydrolase family